MPESVIRSFLSWGGGGGGGFARGGISQRLFLGGLVLGAEGVGGKRWGGFHDGWGVGVMGFWGLVGLGWDGGFGMGVGLGFWDGDGDGDGDEREGCGMLGARWNIVVR